MAYGFVIPNNPDDTSAVKLGIQQALPPDAQVILDRAGLKVDETHHVRFDDPVATGERGQVDSPLPERLTRVVRIACGGSDKPQKTLDQMLKAIRKAADPRENEYLDEVQVEMQAMEVLEGLFQSKAGQAQSRLWRINARKGEEGIRQHVWEACREYAKGKTRRTFVADPRVRRLIQKVRRGMCRSTRDPPIAVLPDHARARRLGGRVAGLYPRGGRLLIAVQKLLPSPMYTRHAHELRTM